MHKRCSSRPHDANERQKVLKEYGTVQSSTIEEMVRIIAQCKGTKMTKAIKSLKKEADYHSNSGTWSKHKTLLKGIFPGIYDTKVVLSKIYPGYVQGCDKLPYLSGTKWCGLNDIAKDYNDLGGITDVDKCCRAHDFCPMNLAGFKKLGKDRNWNPYTLLGRLIFQKKISSLIFKKQLKFFSRSLCACDQEFHDCMRAVYDDPKQDATTKKKAKTIGKFFFNVLEVKCFDPIFPKCPEKKKVHGFFGWIKRTINKLLGRETEKKCGPATGFDARHTEEF